MPFRFLDLPPEIRLKVYLNLCTSPEPISFSPKSRWNTIFEGDDLSLHHYFPFSLLLTCHQLYHEVRPLYFTHNSFCLNITRLSYLLGPFLSPSFRDSRRLIQTLYINIIRFGRHDFFVKEFAPAILDMILNGSLREVEVTIGRHHLEAIEQLQQNNMNRIDKKAEAVLALKTILEDPYLERVLLWTDPKTRTARHSEPSGDALVIPLEDVSSSLLNRSASAPRRRHIGQDD